MRPSCLRDNQRKILRKEENIISYKDESRENQTSPIVRILREQGAQCSYAYSCDMPSSYGVYPIYVIAGNLWFDSIIVFYGLLDMALGQEASPDTHKQVVIQHELLVHFIFSNYHGNGCTQPVVVYHTDMLCRMYSVHLFDS